MMYDQDSGQVFKEWTVRRPSRSASSADGWSRRPVHHKTKVRGVKGPRSLAQMAVTVIADNIGLMTPELLEAMPSRLLLLIWAYFEARQGINLHGWKIFGKLLLSVDEEEPTLGLHRFRQHICKPSEALEVYIQPLTSVNCDFITHIVITGGCSATPQELLSLADIPNLGALEFIHPADETPLPFPDLSDRLIRGWSEKEDPFPLLRILRIWGAYEVTQVSLQPVARFPALALYDVKAYRGDWKDAQDYATSTGWTLEDCREESPFHYLSVLAQVGDMADAKAKREQARSINNDLTSLSSDSRCAIKFVPRGQATSLVDYLTDTAKRTALPSWDADSASRLARECQGIAFEVWAFWLYSLLGELSDDRDLKDRGIKVDEHVVAGPYILPSKPMASLHLGHSGRGGIVSNPAYISRGLFSTVKYTFTRPDVIKGKKLVLVPRQFQPQDQEKSQRSSDRTSEPRRLKKTKLNRLDTMIKSFSKSSSSKKNNTTSAAD